jgi:alpha-1,3-rhamnosyltransferase
MKSTCVSVVIASYNHFNFVEKSIQSVCDQTFDNVELIIVDDGSTDGSIDLLSSLTNINNFRLITQENKGVCKALNNAIRNYASGHYVAILASDDFYHPDKLKKQVELLEANPDAELCYTQAVEFDNGNGSELRTFPRNPISGHILNAVFMRQPYAAGSIMFTRDLFDRIGGFDENLKFEDWDFSMRAAAATRFVAVKKPLFFYRSHGANTLKKWTRRQLFAEKIKILAKNYALVSPARWFYVVLVHFVHDHALMLWDRLRKAP